MAEAELKVEELSGELEDKVNLLILESSVSANLLLFVYQDRELQELEKLKVCIRN